MECENCKILQKKYELSLDLNDNLYYWDWDPNNPKDLVISSAFKNFLDFTDEEMKDCFKSLRSRFHIEDVKEADRLTKEYLQGNIDRYEQIVRYYKRDGSMVYLICKGKLIKDGDKILRMIGVNTDITELKVSGKFDLMSEKFKTFLDLTADGFWEWDLLHPEYQYYSPRFKKMLGYEDDELENTPDTWRSMIHPDDLKITLDNFAKHRDNPNYIFYQKVRYTHKLGHEVNIICRGTIIRNEHDIPVSMIGSHTDITDMTKNERELEKQINKALESSRSTKLFLANMSHEIRTPMNSIVVLSDLMLRDKRLSVKHVDYLNCIVSSAEVLMKLLDDILEYSKLESLNLSLNNQKCFLAEKKKTIFNTWSEKMKEKMIRFKIHLSKSAPKCVIIDKQRFIQIVNILISNAYKYTKSGKVSVKIYIKNEKLCVKVKDTGIGIPLQDQKDLFEPFTRGSNVVNNSGTGIGLSICKTLVTKIGGDIWFKSKENIGSSFYFTYPFTDNIEESEEDKDVIRKVKNRHLEVLIVDDNKVNQYILKEIFDADYPFIRYDIANSGEESIACAKNKSYDIIFMDVVMPPGIDGVEATKRIKEIDPNIYIVAQTANAISGDREKYTKIMDDYIAKPIKSSDLQNIFSRFRKHT